MKEESLDTLNKNAWAKVVNQFSDYRKEIEVTSLFKKFRNIW